MKTKKLTVYEGSGKNYSSIPKIILQGLWLGELGFSIGDKVSVSYQRDRVIIQRDMDGQLQ